MSISRRKMRPSPPRWFNDDTDDCWKCKGNKKYHGCSGCHFLKTYVKLTSRLKQKHYYKKSYIDN